MLRNPHLAEAVSLGAFFAIRTCFNLTADGALKKARPMGYVLNANTAKEEKQRKRKQHFQGNYN